MKHLFGSYNSGIAPQDHPFRPFSLDEWIQQTPTQMRASLIQHLPDADGPWVHILNQTYRLLNSNNRAHGIQKGY